MTNLYHKWLIELTSTPSASGREGRVVQWVKHWAAARPEVVLESDRYGNLYLSRREQRSAGKSDSAGKATPPPIYITAHMDHPSFVVVQPSGGRKVVADFRGGVDEKYFVDTPVLWWPGGSDNRKSGQQDSTKSERSGVERGRVVALDPPRENRWARRATIAFEKPIDARPGDVITWDTGPARVHNGRLYAPGCDDMAGVAAALGAFDSLLCNEARAGEQENRRAGDRKGSTLTRRPGGRHPLPQKGEGLGADIRVLLTRAEEVGFIGAIAACKSRLIPKNARLICLENSKSFAESPIGGGPIVRVGDKTSTFDPDLTYRICQIAQGLAEAGRGIREIRGRGFKWQRKLMPGGTCEATVFVSFGYAATCLCSPLGNYHNMNETTGKIDAETISLSDHDGLIRLLVAIGQTLDDPAAAPPFLARLEGLFAGRKGLLDESEGERGKGLSLGATGSLSAAPEAADPDEIGTASAKAVGLT